MDCERIVDVLFKINNCSVLHSYSFLIVKWLVYNLNFSTVGTPFFFTFLITQLSLYAQRFKVLSYIYSWSYLWSSRGTFFIVSLKFNIFMFCAIETFRINRSLWVNFLVIEIYWFTKDTERILNQISCFFTNHTSIWRISIFLS